MATGRYWRKQACPNTSSYAWTTRLRQRCSTHLRRSYLLSHGYACCGKRQEIPLALVELSSAAGVPEDELSVPGGPALTERLERAFAARAFDLPEATRTVLLVAALNDEDGIGEILGAARTITGDALDLDAVAPAAAAGIVDADLQTIRFRHPLMRSALARSSDLVERRRAHEALADTLADQPDRRAWHRAALLTGEHEDVAVELEDAATRARRRGARSGRGERDETCGRDRRTSKPQPAPACRGRAGRGSRAAGSGHPAAQRGEAAGSRRIRSSAAHLGRGDRSDAPARRQALQVADRARRSTPERQGTTTSMPICSGSSPNARGGWTQVPR